MSSLPLASIPVALGQLTGGHGWLTNRLLNITLSSAEWVLWLLVSLSVLSVAVILERLLFFSTHRLPQASAVLGMLTRGDLEGARNAVASHRGLEAEVVRQGVAAAKSGVSAAEEAMAMAAAQERLRYERFLSFLGTLGANAPFVGLFGTVLGIIKSFADLGKVSLKGAAVQQTVMTGISEALVATAVGLAVAIPAVVAYNGFTRWLKNMSASANALSHALTSHLHGDGKLARPAEKSPVRSATAVKA